VEVLEPSLRVLPAVIAGARVEVHEPESLDLRAEREDLSSPFSDDPLAFLFGLLAFGEPRELEDRFRSELLDLRKERAGFFQGEDLLLG